MLNGAWGCSGSGLAFTRELPEGYRVVRPKICEMCGRNFLQEERERDCPGCVAKLTASKEPIPPVDSPQEKLHWRDPFPMPMGRIQ